VKPKASLRNGWSTLGLKNIIVGVETVDKMTDRQIAAKVRERFPA